MGTVFPRQSDNMKLVAVLALAAVPAAYGDYGYVASYAPPTLGNGEYRPYGYGYYYGKMSSDAEPDAADRKKREAVADPALLYGSCLPYFNSARSYGAYRTYGANSYGGYYYGKRSADAAPEADAEADPALL